MGTGNIESEDRIFTYRRLTRPVVLGAILTLHAPVTGEVFYDAALRSAAGIAIIIRKILPLLLRRPPERD